VENLNSSLSLVSEEIITLILCLDQELAKLSKEVCKDKFHYGWETCGKMWDE